MSHGHPLPYLCSECGDSFSNSEFGSSVHLVQAALLKCVLRLDLVGWALPGVFSDVDSYHEGSYCGFVSAEV